MRVHPKTKTNTKTRHKNRERGTACRLKVCTLSSANSPHRRGYSAKKTNCLSLTALCVLVGLILWACLHQSQPSKENKISAAEAAVHLPFPSDHWSVSVKNGTFIRKRNISSTTTSYRPVGAESLKVNVHIVTKTYEKQTTAYRPA